MILEVAADRGDEIKPTTGDSSQNKNTRQIIIQMKNVCLCICIARLKNFCALNKKFHERNKTHHQYLLCSFHYAYDCHCSNFYFVSLSLIYCIVADAITRRKKYIYYNRMKEDEDYVKEYDL
jgi:flagellar biosynthesis protein FlhB